MRSGKVSAQGPATKQHRPNSWRRGLVVAGVALSGALGGLLGGMSGAFIVAGVAVTLAGLLSLFWPAAKVGLTRRASIITAIAGAVLLAGGAFSAGPTGPQPTPAPTTASRTPPPHPSSPQSPTATASPRPIPERSPASGQPPADTTALAGLAELTVKGRGPKTGYSRSQYGDARAVGAAGCTTRQTVLRRDLADIQLLAADPCIVLHGRLNDPYTGAAITATTTSIDDLEVDHIVALSDAWQKGAAQLNQTQRELFAHDLLNLQTTIGAVNASKGDGDAATWLPPNVQHRCPYVARQIAVKAKYQLSITKAEKAAMLRVLERCPHQRLPTAASVRKVVDQSPTLVVPTPGPEPSLPATTTHTDPRFPSCKAANAAGYGNYRRGHDPEYYWYRDNDDDGIACEQ